MIRFTKGNARIAWMGVTVLQESSGKLGRERETAQCAVGGVVNRHRSECTAAKPQHEVEGRFFLDVVVREGAPILELLPREDEALLIGRDAFLVLDFGLDRFDGVGRFDLEGDGLTG